MFNINTNKSMICILFLKKHLYKKILISNNKTFLNSKNNMNYNKSKNKSCSKNKTLKNILNLLLKINSDFILIIFFFEFDF